jgi:beta-phosphoglucomutase-like phosphatase (HAD superfamily)
MKLRYPCLVVDHDDTSVMSTPAIHYPAHVEAMRVLSPGRAPVSLEGFLERNFDPGLIPFLSGELGWGEEEISRSYAIWRGFTASRVPDFFPGILELYAEYRESGGKLAVVSHSDVRIILRDYRAANAIPLGLGPRSARNAIPDLVFGWDGSAGPDGAVREDSAAEHRKPHPYPLLETMCEFGLGPHDLLVLDDLKPGADMAAAAGVDFAAALWGHSIPSIRAAMAGLADYLLERVDELRELLFS